MVDRSRDILDREIQKIYHSGDFERKFEILEAEVSMNPDTPVDDIFRDFTDLVIPLCRTLDDKILLAILSWYVPQNLRFQLILWLDQNWGPEQKEVKEVILVSKVWALAWLQIQNRWNANDFFGLLKGGRLKGIVANIAHRRIIHRKAKIRRYTGWCRGHRDGTAPIHSNLSRVYPSREEILEIERKRNLRELIYQENLQALRGRIETVLQVS